MDDMYIMHQLSTRDDTILITALFSTEHKAKSFVENIATQCKSEPIWERMSEKELIGIVSSGKMQAVFQIKRMKIDALAKN